jgi:hypothetical protein
MSKFDIDDDAMFAPRRKVKPPPLGKPAEKGSKLAIARVVAHKAFDPTWQSGEKTRSGAYRELARLLGMTKIECHFLNFDLATCEKVIALYVANEFEVLK